MVVMPNLTLVDIQVTHMTTPKLHLYPIQSTHMYEAYPKLREYLSHSSNDSVHSGAEGEAESTLATSYELSSSDSDTSSSSNVIPMFRR